MPNVLFLLYKYIVLALIWVCKWYIPELLTLNISQQTQILCIDLVINIKICHSFIQVYYAFANLAANQIQNCTNWMAKQQLHTLFSAYGYDKFKTCIFFSMYFILHSKGKYLHLLKFLIIKWDWIKHTVHRRMVWLIHLGPSKV